MYVLSSEMDNCMEQRNRRSSVIVVFLRLSTDTPNWRVPVREIWRETYGGVDDGLPHYILSVHSHQCHDQSDHCHGSTVYRGVGVGLYHSVS